MKVIMVGSERRLFDEQSAARARIVQYGTIVEELHIIALTIGGGLEEVQLSPNVWLYPTNSRSRLFYVFDAVRLGKRLKSRQIDLTSAQDPFESGVAAWRIAKKIRSKLHLQLHTDVFSPYFAAESFLNTARAKVARHLLKKADAVRVVSHRIADSIRENHIPLKKEPVVLPIFVDINKFTLEPRSSYLQDKYPRYDAYVLMVARLEIEKNFGMALAAFAEVSYKRNACLVIIGSGSKLAELESIARDLNIKERVKFVGWKDSVIDEYTSATVLLSTSDYEGYGMTFIESAASSLPIVTTDVGIAREVFGDEGAYISPVRDVGRIAANLDTAISNREDAAKKAAIAREKVRKMLGSESDYIQQYKLAWEKAL